MKRKFWKCTFVRGNELCLSSIDIMSDSLTGAINFLLESLSEEFVDKYLCSVTFTELVSDE